MKSRDDENKEKSWGTTGSILGGLFGARSGMRQAKEVFTRVMQDTKFSSVSTAASAQLKRNAFTLGGGVVGAVAGAVIGGYIGCLFGSAASPLAGEEEPYRHSSQMGR